ncbi:MAG: YraN family protein [Candidatus Peribacter sp.]|jgi:putative endonuclease|nr:YraN family protein [Candidatus Peribacter sp.]MBT4393456.1 YraN family protein [Candidatus Peribacter sp.]MBT4600567.1 YraN family protein [Candidatus Peribacter sp.]MBT5149462.1 YraN family protein [Candidatus Peribacter sp.]MBT5638592.1 YraN family protein [Candidatus Peribacter sp.]
MNHLQVGKQGEALAKAHLQDKKYKIYDQNIRLGRDEIDIIAYDTAEKMLVFVEVKTRSRYDADFLPALGLTPRKKRALRRAAWKWMQLREYDAPWRIDIILVIGTRVQRHIKQMH